MVLITFQKIDPNVVELVFHHAAALTWRGTIFPIFPALFPDADIMEWGCFFWWGCLSGWVLPGLGEDWEVSFTKQTPIHPSSLDSKSSSSDHSSFHIYISNVTLTLLHHNLSIYLFLLHRELFEDGAVLLTIANLIQPACLLPGTKERLKNMFVVWKQKHMNEWAKWECKRIWR